MILRRLASGLRRQDWTTVFIELLVVVVGLLLGLELNNWAHDLKDRRLIDAYYDQLILDLESDVATGERGVSQAEHHAAMGELVYRVATDGDVDGVSDEELAIALVVAGYTERPLITRHTYEELISTGSLRLIKNLDVKRTLGTYYARSKSARQWDELIQYEQMRYRDAIRGILTPAQMRWVRSNFSDTSQPIPGFDRARFIRSVQERPEIVDSLSALAAEQTRLMHSSAGIAEAAAMLIEKLSN